MNDAKKDTVAKSNTNKSEIDNSKSIINIATRRLSIEDFDMAKSFFDVEVEKLADKKFFLKYSEDELKSILSGNGFFLGGFIDNKLVATCAVDFDLEYGEILKTAIFSQNVDDKNCDDKPKSCEQANLKLNDVAKRDKKLNDSETFDFKPLDSGLKQMRFYEYSGVFVAEGYRKMGLASRLCGEVLEFSKSQLSPCVLCSLVQFDNVPSSGNLKKLGFDWVFRKAYKEYLFDYFILKV